MAASQATAAAKAALAFTPRTTYDASPSITRSYFLGHHYAALNRMRRILSNIGLIIECRDFRVPITSWNPLLETSLTSQGLHADRIIAYTKHDLGPPPSGPGGGGGLMSKLTAFHRAEHPRTAVVFLSRSRGAQTLLRAVKDVARRHDSLTGLRALVVGMPNAGKSTLLNTLRGQGMKLPKAAATGAQPGVTRKLGTPVRVVAGDEADGIEAGVFIMDTPGVFVPYVADAESMLKLALVGCVRDGVIGAVTVADYLLFHLNLHDPGLYAGYCGPTNDVYEFLEGVARRTGRLGKGGLPSLEGAADWIVQEWRKGGLGTFVLDDVNAKTLEAAKKAAADPPVSFTQAKKREKEQRKVRAAERRQGGLGGGD